MDFNFGNSRERVVKQVLMFDRIAPPNAARAIPVSEQLSQDQIITSFTVNNYSTAASSVFLGVDRDMRSSIEIPPGTAPTFTVFQEGRQLYELQILIMKISSQTAQDLIKIPVLCWDLTHWFLLSGGTTPEPVTIVAYPLPYL